MSEVIQVKPTPESEPHDVKRYALHARRQTIINALITMRNGQQLPLVDVLAAHPDCSDTILGSLVVLDDPEYPIGSEIYETEVTDSQKVIDFYTTKYAAAIEYPES